MDTERLDEIRRLLGSQSVYWLAQECGLSYQTVWRTLNGRTEPTFATIEAIYSALGYEIQFKRKAKNDRANDS